MSVESWTILGVILTAPVAIFGMCWMLMTEEQRDRLRLILGILRMRYIFRMDEHGFRGDLPDWVGYCRTYMRYHIVIIVPPDSVPKYPVRLEIREPTNRFEFQWRHRGLNLRREWGEKTNPTRRRPRCREFDCPHKGSGILGVVGIRHEKQGPKDEFLVWRFTSLGVAIGKGKISIP